jgi:hypothetical protein
MKPGTIWGSILALGLVFSLLLISCSGGANTVPIATARPVSSTPTWVTIQIKRIQILRGPGDLDQISEFRLFMVASGQDRRYAAGLVFPANTNLSARVGDVVDASAYGLSVDENSLADELYVYFAGIDSDQQSFIVNEAVGQILSLIAEGLWRAIGVSHPVASVVTGFVLDALYQYVQQDDIIGDGLIVLNRRDNWNAGQVHEFTSANGGLHITYEVFRNKSTSSGPGATSVPILRQPESTRPLVTVTPRNPTTNPDTSRLCARGSLARIENIAPPLSEVRGRVVRVDGSAVVGARLQNYVPGYFANYHPETLTDANGGYNFASLDPQPYRVTLLSPSNGNPYVDFIVTEYGHSYVVDFTVDDCSRFADSKSATSVSVEQAVSRYYSLLEQKQYATTWRMLSDEFNTSVHVTTLDSYISGWEESGPATIVGPVEAVEDGNQASVTLTLYYRKKDVSVRLRYGFILDHERGDPQFGYWLLVRGAYAR